MTASTSPPPPGGLPGAGLPAGGESGGFVWSGDLANVRVNALYAACHSLRFTGTLELRDDHHHAEVRFIGGDPVEIDGGDTQVIALWNAGTFRAKQSIPNLSGELTDVTEQTGSLAITKAPRLLAWVSEYRLSCELLIERPGEKAQLVFKNGQLESAEVNGKPELSAMIRVQGWGDGFYRVRLRPLFHAGVIALAPPPAEGAAPAGREFDVSRSIPLDLKERARLHTPPPPTVSVGSPASLESERAAQRPQIDNPSARPQGMARIPSGTDPVVPISERPAVAPEAPAPRSRAGLWLFLLLLIGAGTLGALFALHLPPFSPLPRPLDEQVGVTKPKPEPVPQPETVTTKPEPAAKPEPATKPEAATKPATKPEPIKPIDPATLEPKDNEKPSAKPLPAVAPLDERLIDKGRLLLIDGHPHSAVSLFRKAEQANPKSALAKLLTQQALGKLGRAELSIEGHGHLVVDGKPFEAGKKLKLFAGPHAIDSGNGPEELTLKKGEHKRLHARP